MLAGVLEEGGGLVLVFEASEGQFFFGISIFWYDYCPEVGQERHLKGREGVEEHLGGRRVLHVEVSEALDVLRDVQETQDQVDVSAHRQRD